MCKYKIILIIKFRFINHLLGRVESNGFTVEGWIGVAVEGELGLAFVEFSFWFNVVGVLVFLVLTLLCWSSLINKTTTKHKSKHKSKT
jgi:hypothetical protein